MRSSDYFNFDVVKSSSCSQARAGLLSTPHGLIETPIFMPVGTNSAVKMMTFDQVRATGAQIILANSYHMYLRAGCELVKKAGGLHGWMNWDKPILTDSGGFQVFSLAKLRKITDDGVYFQDPKNGSKHFISPEISMKIQEDLGADIIMAFDECAPYPCDYKQARSALDKTHRWLERCFEAHKNYNQALFPIVQGAFFDDLRIESANFVSKFDFDVCGNDILLILGSGTRRADTTRGKMAYLGICWHIIPCKSGKKSGKVEGRTTRLT